MSAFVVIRDMSAGNESVGEMWQETKVFDGSATLDQVMHWAMDAEKWPHQKHSNKRITITKPDESQP